MKEVVTKDVLGNIVGTSMSGLFGSGSDHVFILGDYTPGQIQDLTFN